MCVCVVYVCIASPLLGKLLSQSTQASDASATLSSHRMAMTKLRSALTTAYAMCECVVCCLCLSVCVCAYGCLSLAASYRLLGRSGNNCYRGRIVVRAGGWARYVRPKRETVQLGDDAAGGDGGDGGGGIRTAERAGHPFRHRREQRLARRLAESRLATER